jgi:hypothetical protein
MPQDQPETVGDAMLGLENAMAPHMNQLADMAKQRLLAAEVDVQRSMIAFNGAGLTSVVSLIKSPVPGVWTHFAAWSFFLGLSFGAASWLLQMRFMSVIYRLPGVFPHLREQLRKSGHHDRTLTELMPDVETTEAVEAAVVAATHHTFARIKRVGRPADIAGYFAFAFFLVGALSLVLGFQFG